MKYYCEDCGSEISESGLDYRHSTLEDCTDPWDLISVCPVCGGENLTEMTTCKRCGADIKEGLVCEDCKSDIEFMLESLVATLKIGCFTRENAVEVILDVLEEKYC